MATCQLVYRAPDGVAAIAGDTLWLIDRREWTVQTVLENRDNGEQLLRMEIADEDLSTCDWP